MKTYTFGDYAIEFAEIVGGLTLCLLIALTGIAGLCLAGFAIQTFLSGNQVGGIIVAVPAGVILTALWLNRHTSIPGISVPQR